MSRSTSRMNVVVIDYGVGNVHSVVAVFRQLGHRVETTGDLSDIAACDLAVLPGVGSAKEALPKVRYSGAAEAIKARTDAGRPTIGICLGAQLLFGSNEEADGAPGLEVFEGSVRRIEDKGTNTGWRQLDFDELRDIGLARGLRSSSTYFFNHEFGMAIDGSNFSCVHAVEPRLPALVARGSTVAVQFHPEKSQASGVRLMRNVIDYVGS